MEYLTAAGVRLAAQLLASLIVLYAAKAAGQWLYLGYRIRREVQRLRASGVPTLPHSWLWGHLGVVAEFRRTHPADASMMALHAWVLEQHRRFFPGAAVLPAVIHLDLWPAMGTPLMLVTHPDAVAQFTQTTNLPKAPYMRDALRILTGARDIASTEGPIWRLWRSRFNPGFGSRNIAALLPEMIEEAGVFSEALEGLAGSGGGWGPVFQFEEKTTNLTLDIIVRACLDVRLQEQTRRSSSPFKMALLDQLDKMARVNHPLRGWGLLGAARERSAVERNNRVMADYLTPAIRARWQKLCASAAATDDKDAGNGPPAGSDRTTVIDLALRTLYPEKGDAGGGEAGLDADFLDLLLANAKVFLFGGHDTTASSLCWLVKLLAAHPRALERLRAEHDAVLGPLGTDDDGLAALRAAPRRLYALPYTLAVIKETLRLYPLLGTMRQGRPGFALVVDDAGRPRAYDTAGWVLWDATPIVQCRPDVWPRGADFVPERWLAGDPAAEEEEGEEGEARDDARGDAHLRQQQKNAWRAFGQGPRKCIGQELAMTELRLVAVLLARRFDIEEAWEAWDATRPNPGPDPPPTIAGQRAYCVGNGTVHPKDGMPVRVRLRRPETRRAIGEEAGKDQPR